MKALLRCWFCDVTAFTKSLIRLDNLSQPVLRRESRGPSGSSLRGVGGRVTRAGREGFAHWRVVFKQSDLDPPTGGWSNPNVSVWGGAPPMSRVSGAMPTSSDISFIL